LQADAVAGLGARASNSDSDADAENSGETYSSLTRR
jgi:hypothetical protein